ncbi:Uncharacterised protein [uncultured archaeon]|nr:Uncharacterised protein [uncultured archaeon]
MEAICCWSSFFLTFFPIRSRCSSPFICSATSNATSLSSSSSSKSSSADETSFSPSSTSLENTDLSWVTKLSFTFSSFRSSFFCCSFAGFGAGSSFISGSATVSFFDSGAGFFSSCALGGCSLTIAGSPRGLGAAGLAASLGFSASFLCTGADLGSG